MIRVSGVPSLLLLCLVGYFSLRVDGIPILSPIHRGIHCWSRADCENGEIGKGPESGHSLGMIRQQTDEKRGNRRKGVNSGFDNFLGKIPIIKKLPVLHFRRFWFPGFHPLPYELSTTAPETGGPKKEKKNKKKKKKNKKKDDGDTMEDFAM